MKWVSVKDRMPPDRWFGLVVTDIRPDKPVMAHTADVWYREEFPFADYFLGPWRDALLTADAFRDKAKVTYWLEGFVYPEPPKPAGDTDGQ